jgi:hypothetical protein
VSGTDNVIDGGGWGTVISSATDHGLTVTGIRNIIRNIKVRVTGAKRAIFLDTGSDTSTVENCYAWSGSNVGLLTNSSELKIKGNTLIAPGSVAFYALSATAKRLNVTGNIGSGTASGAVDIYGDYHTFVGNNFEGTLVIEAGSDSSIYTGNNIKGSITNGGTGNKADANNNVTR